MTNTKCTKDIQQMEAVFSGLMASFDSLSPRIMQRGAGVSETPVWINLSGGLMIFYAAFFVVIIGSSPVSSFSLFPFAKHLSRDLCSFLHIFTSRDVHCFGVTYMSSASRGTDGGFSKRIRFFNIEHLSKPCDRQRHGNRMNYLFPLCGLTVGDHCSRCTNQRLTSVTLRLTGDTPNTRPNDARLLEWRAVFPD